MMETKDFLISQSVWTEFRRQIILIGAWWEIKFKMFQPWTYVTVSSKDIEILVPSPDASMALDSWDHNGEGLKSRY